MGWVVVAAIVVALAVCIPTEIWAGVLARIMVIGLVGMTIAWGLVIIAAPFALIWWAVS